MLLLAACMPMRDSRPPTAGEFERSRTVVILDHLGGGGICSGVVVQDHVGRAVVITAAHCVAKHVDPTDEESPRVAELGQAVWFVLGNEWLPRRGLLYSYDLQRDRCIVEAADLPTPLHTRRLADTAWQVPGETFHAVSALYERVSRGAVLGESYADAGSFFWDSTIDIKPGWSGSPVVDSRGAVVGLVIKCRTLEVHPGTVCDKNSAIFTDPL